MDKVNRLTLTAAVLEVMFELNTSRPAVGFFDSLTPEQQKAALEYDGPVLSGDPSFPRLKRNK